MLQEPGVSWRRVRLNGLRLPPRASRSLFLPHFTRPDWWRAGSHLDGLSRASRLSGRTSSQVGQACRGVREEEGQAEGQTKHAQEGKRGGASGRTAVVNTSSVHAAMCPVHYVWCAAIFVGMLHRSHHVI